MNNLELKIPPIIVVISCGLLMFLVAKIAPNIGLSLAFRASFFGFIGVLAVVIALLGIYRFKQAKTSANPKRPETASSLVEDGIYIYTRNPMYLGFVLLLLGWGVFLDSFFALLLLPVFIFYLNQFQIKPEERALSQIFGKAFDNYRKKTRRWL